jgi:hypothetical protein
MQYFSLFVFLLSHFGKVIRLLDGLHVNLRRNPVA